MSPGYYKAQDKNSHISAIAFIQKGANILVQGNLPFCTLLFVIGMRTRYSIKTLNRVSSATLLIRGWSLFWKLFLTCLARRRYMHCPFAAISHTATIGILVGRFSFYCHPTNIHGYLPSPSAALLAAPQLKSAVSMMRCLHPAPVLG